MDIKSLKITSIKIPFKVSFKHNSAERKVTQSILVTAESQNGHIGKGEGCPREYVTNESIESSLCFFADHELQIRTIHSFQELETWVAHNEEEIDNNPAAWCAIELALLDLISKDNSQSVEKTMGLRELNDSTFQYTAVLGDLSPEKFQSQVKQYASLGFTDFKLKVSGDPAIDNLKLQILSAENIPNLRIRFDTNNFWKDPKEVINYLHKIAFQPFALEEPLNAFNFKGLIKVTEKYKGKIILDESFVNQKQFEELKNNPDHFIINLRISKMGGMIRSLKIARQATLIGIPLIIGAQVGETSILTRSAITVANVIKDNLIAQEGAYGILLLENDIVSAPLMFGKKGILKPSKILRKDLYGFQLKYL